MTCHDVQTKLSLYLYGELEFAAEEQLEQHVAECPVCERALAREKTWHGALNAGRADVPLELLEQCRRELKRAVVARPMRSVRPWWIGWAEPLGFFERRWSVRLAAASFLLFVGFTAGRLIDRNGLPGAAGITADTMGMINPATARIREIDPGENDRVRIVFDQERSVSGPMNSAEMRAWLLAASKDEDDPAVRVDSVEMLNRQAGREVRDALLYSARNDPNAGVRLKAIEGLARFREDGEVREGLVFVLQHEANAVVRSKAMDVLAPASGMKTVSPDLAGALEDVMRSGQQDDYVRLRCAELLRQIGGPLDVY